MRKIASLFVKVKFPRKFEKEFKFNKISGQGWIKLS